MSTTPNRWATAHVDRCRAMESAACADLVAFGGGSRTRKRLADALRGWRQIGDHDRARWLARHAYFITGEVSR
jgi:hypothetical protein